RAVAGYGAGHVTAPSPALPRDEALLEGFARAELASSPFAYSVDPSGESTLGMIEADPFRDAAPSRDLLSDGEWVSLQSICVD
ncbi:hypothetical protein R0K19_22640, partial [Bacillus sp. SIMBA_161]